MNGYYVTRTPRYLYFYAIPTSKYAQPTPKQCKAKSFISQSLVFQSRNISINRIPLKMAIIQGSYILKENDNLTGILAAQGVGKLESNLANEIHNNQTLTIQYTPDEKTINETNIFGRHTNVVEYIIDGPYQRREESGGRGVLRNSVVLSDDGFVLTREAESGNFIVIDTYIFNSDDGRLDIFMKCTTKDGKVVEAKRHFVKEGY